MPAWPELTIAQCCTRVTSGGTPRRNNPDYYRDGTIPWVKTGELKDRVIDSSTIGEWITKEAVDNSSAKVLPRNTVLMAMYGDGRTIGSLGLVRSPVSCNQACCAMIPNPDVCDAQFLFYAIRHYRNAWIKIAHGGAQRNLSGSIIRERKIAVPVLPAQKRIASILGAYDELIDVNRRRIVVLEDMAQRLFEEWFVHFRFPGHERHALVETRDGKLPAGWNITALDQLCERITDGAHHSPPSVETGRLMASVKDMRDWDFDLSGCRQISDGHFEELVRNGCQPSVGDILIAKDGANLNKHTFLMWREVPLVLLSSIAIVRPLEDFQREFLVALLKSDAISKAIKQMKSGAAIPRIVLRDFKRLQIALPPATLRQRFDDLAAPIHGLARRLSLVNGSLAESRDLLLPRLISGELSITSAERELEAVA